MIAIYNYNKDGEMAKEIDKESYPYAEDENYKIRKEYTRVKDGDRVDRYVDTYLYDKETGEERKVQHDSYHSSGLKNTDIIGTNSTTHVHGTKDGGKRAFDENHATGERDYEEYENE